MDKVKISEIPNEFIKSNLTSYQIGTIEMKYNIYLQFLEMQKNMKRKRLEDIYLIIAERMNMQVDTICKIIIKIKKNMK